jgi:hypothetical protein
MFSNAIGGDLHLKGTASRGIDQAPALPSVLDDIDGNPRPCGTAYDIGADEFCATGSLLSLPTNPRVISPSAMQ